MAELEVAIERLEPMRVLWVREVGPTPEQAAWARLRSWAEQNELLDQLEQHPVFGFNNPAPEAGAAEYGYEMWSASEGNPTGLDVKEFPGGLYATTCCELVGSPGIQATWKALLRWVHTSRYSWRRGTHELERILNPMAAEQDLQVTLYLPIEE